MWDTYFKEDKGIYAAIGTMVLVVFISLLFRRIRYWALRPFRWLNQAPLNANETQQ